VAAALQIFLFPLIDPAARTASKGAIQQRATGHGADRGTTEQEQYEKKPMR
jgi:hypothetical protein